MTFKWDIQIVDLLMYEKYQIIQQNYTFRHNLAMFVKLKKAIFFSSHPLQIFDKFYEKFP